MIAEQQQQDERKAPPQRSVSDSALNRGGFNFLKLFGGVAQAGGPAAGGGVIKERENEDDDSVYDNDFSTQHDDDDIFDEDEDESIEHDDDDDDSLHLVESEEKDGGGDCDQDDNNHGNDSSTTLDYEDNDYKLDKSASSFSKKSSKAKSNSASTNENKNVTPKAPAGTTASAAAAGIPSYSRKKIASNSAAADANRGVSRNFSSVMEHVDHTVDPTDKNRGISRNFSNTLSHFFSNAIGGGGGALNAGASNAGSLDGSTATPASYPTKVSAASVPTTRGVPRRSSLGAILSSTFQQPQQQQQPAADKSKMPRRASTSSNHSSTSADPGVRGGRRRRRQRHEDSFGSQNEISASGEDDSEGSYSSSSSTGSPAASAADTASSEQQQRQRRAKRRGKKSSSDKNAGLSFQELCIRDAVAWLIKNAYATNNNPEEQDSKAERIFRIFKAALQSGDLMITSVTPHAPLPTNTPPPPQPQPPAATSPKPEKSPKPENKRGSSSNLNKTPENKRGSSSNLNNNNSKDKKEEPSSPLTSTKDNTSQKNTTTTTSNSVMMNASSTPAGSALHFKVAIKSKQRDDSFPALHIKFVPLLPEQLTMSAAAALAKLSPAAAAAGAGGTRQGDGMSSATAAATGGGADGYAAAAAAAVGSSFSTSSVLTSLWRNRSYLSLDQEYALLRRMHVQFAIKDSDQNNNNNIGASGNSPIPTPYAYVDIPDAGKLVLSEWIPTINTTMSETTEPLETTTTTTSVKQEKQEHGTTTTKKQQQTILLNSWAHQFVGGKVDLSLLTRLTEMLAQLHCCLEEEEDLGEEFFKHVYSRSTDTRSLLPNYPNDLFYTSCYMQQQQQKQKLSSSLSSQKGSSRKSKLSSLSMPPASPSSSSPEKDEPQPNRVAVLARELGPRTCSVITGSILNDYHRRDCMIHNDLHLFNVMAVKKSTSQSSYSSFNINQEDSRLIVPSWKSARMGPVGRDLGCAVAWPIACYVWHSGMARTSQAEECFEFVQDFWLDYSASIWSSCNRLNINNDDGEDDEFNRADAYLTPHVFRNMMAWCGWFLYVRVYQTGDYCNTLTFDSDETRSKVMESIGYLGLRFMHWGFVEFEPTLTIEELETRFLDILQSESQRVVPRQPEKKSRRPMLVTELSQRQMTKRVAMLQKHHGQPLQPSQHSHHSSHGNGAISPSTSQHSQTNLSKQSSHRKLLQKQASKRSIQKRSLLVNQDSSRDLNYIDAVTEATAAEQVAAEHFAPVSPVMSWSRNVRPNSTAPRMDKLSSHHRSPRARADSSDSVNKNITQEPTFPAAAAAADTAFSSSYLNSPGARSPFHTPTRTSSSGSRNTPTRTSSSGSRKAQMQQLKNLDLYKEI